MTAIARMPNSFGPDEQSCKRKKSPPVMVGFLKESGRY
jgi:hypothetical protein